MDYLKLIIIWILLVISYLVCFNIYQQNEQIKELKIYNEKMYLILKKIMG